MRLGRLGNVILVGRGATAITGQLDNAIHVRLIGSLEKRVQHVEDYFKLTREKAASYVERKERERKRYFKKFFDKRIDNPLLYHLILNTDRVSYDEAARMIGEAVIRRLRAAGSMPASAPAAQAA